MSDPSNGSVALGADGSFTYTPEANFNGADSFIYQADDGNGGSDTATVNISVSPVNDAPQTQNDSYTAEEDTPLVVAAPGVLSNDVDVDEDMLIVTVVTEPVNGSLVLNANGSFTYTPESNFSGADSFMYQADDGNDGSDTATVNISVSPLNDAPQAENDSYMAEEDTPLIIAAAGVLSNDVDADGDQLTAAPVTGPSNGTLELNADGSFTYTPESNFSGSDSFVYRADDGNGDSDTATVDIMVRDVSASLSISADAPARTARGQFGHDKLHFHRHPYRRYERNDNGELCGDGYR